MKNKITVVICLYNAEKFILETLDSLNSQTFNDFNLLIVDDHSTDKSVAVVKKYLSEHELLESELICFDENKGTAHLRGFSLEYVKTPLMMFFDADDIAKPQLIERLQNKIFSNENIIAVSCYSKYIDNDSNQIVGGQFIGPTTEMDFIARAEAGKLIFMLPPTLFKRNYAIKAGSYRVKGFPEGGRRYQDLSEDLDLWSRMSDFHCDGKMMLTIPEELFFYRKVTSSLSASKDSLIAMQDKIRFIKHNLKRRRQGEKEIDFISYRSSFSRKEKLGNYIKDMSAYHYREAGFLLVRRSYTRFIYHILISVLLNPTYLLDKIKSNLIKERRS